MTLSRNAKVAFDFFYQHGGFSVRRNETEQTGRARSAREYAQAEARAAAEGIWYEWRIDEEGCNGCECGNQECDCFTGEPHEVLGCIAHRQDDSGFVSLWGICKPSREYRRVVEAELAMELLG